jgi:hypothetical protein
MPGTLQVGGNTVITHTGDSGAGTNTINSAVVFPSGHIIQTDYGMHSSTYYDSSQGTSFPGTTLPGQLGDGSVNLTPMSSSNLIEISYVMQCAQKHSFTSFFFRAYSSVDGGSNYTFITESGSGNVTVIDIGSQSGYPYQITSLIIKPVSYFTSSNQNIKFRMNSCKDADSASGLLLNVNTNDNSASTSTNFVGTCSTLIVKEIKG